MRTASFHTAGSVERSREHTAQPVGGYIMVVIVVAVVVGCDEKERGEMNNV
jgi:hypothetical protein